MLITDSAKTAKYYQALLDRDSRYLGIFFAAVRTTSIFCLPICSAKKPKRKNVEFYTTLKDALAAGYRPCKICRPTERANEAPAQVKEAISLVRKNPKMKVSDAVLREYNIPPATLRRWFNKHYGMTFQAYQRMYRMNVAFQELQRGKSTTAAAMESGYESLSGFGYTYKKLMGRSPRESVGETVIACDRITTPLGPMYICATDAGVCLIEFVDRKALETEFGSLQKKLKARIVTGENEKIRQAKAQIEAYFAGDRHTFDLPLVTTGTDFQSSVWTQLQTITYGQTWSYQALADSLDKPRAVRAVAAANGANKLAIVIPCHRVIGKDGGLTGYAGGLERKRWLLEHEGAIKGTQTLNDKQTELFT